MSVVPDRQPVAGLPASDSLCIPGPCVGWNMESAFKKQSEHTTYQAGQRGKSFPGESWPGVGPSLSWIWPV